MHRALSLSMILSVSASIKKGKKRIAARLTALAMTGSGKTDCRTPDGARNDVEWKNGLSQPFTRLRNDRTTAYRAPHDIRDN